jgi:hypothetical protein
MKRWFAASLLLLLAAAPAHADPDVKGALTKVLGKTPGQIGPAFAGVTMGATKAKGLPKGVAARDAAFKKKYGVELVEITAQYGDEVEGVYADLGHGAAAAVTAVWGPFTDKDAQVWVDATHHTCAEIAGDDETVVFRRCQPTADLIGAKTDRFAFEPYPLLGSSLAKLKKKLGATIAADDGAPWGGKDSETAWSFPTLPQPGADSAMVEAIVDGGDTIVRVQLATGTEGKDGIAAAITKKLGAKPTDDGGDQVWKASGVSVRLHELNGTEHGVLYVSVTAAK